MVVGIKYELLGSTEVPKSERAAAPRPPKKAPRKTPASETPKATPARTGKERPLRQPVAAKFKVVPFQHEPEGDDDDEAITELKKRVRHAMAVLEEGKPVAAFNLLKRIAED